jgi:hypothetical protein
MLFRACDLGYLVTEKSAERTSAREFKLTRQDVGTRSTSSEGVPILSKPKSPQGFRPKDGKASNGCSKVRKADEKALAAILPASRGVWTEAEVTPKEDIVECAQKWEDVAEREAACHFHNAESIIDEGAPGHPPMPVVRGCTNPHRERIDSSPSLVTAMVTRPVGRQEVAREAAARAAMEKEWKGLRDKGVWRKRDARDRSGVIRDARRTERHAQFGRDHGICVERNCELPVGHRNRKRKGTVGVLGNQAVNPDFDRAVFADLGSAPSTLESARLTDFDGRAARYQGLQIGGQRVDVSAQRRL